MAGSNPLGTLLLEFNVTLSSVKSGSIIAIPLNISVIMVSNVFVATGDAKCRFRWRSGG